MLFDFSKSPLQNINNLKENKNYNVVNVPIQVENNDWVIYDEKNGKFISKKYEFNDIKHMLYFLSEILKELTVKSIFPKITILELEVNIDIIPEFLEEITSFEISITKFIDEVYEDIRYI
jgi:hypothetical protein